LSRYSRGRYEFRRDLLEPVDTALSKSRNVQKAHEATDCRKVAASLGGTVGQRTIEPLPAELTFRHKPVESQLQFRQVHTLLMWPVRMLMVGNEVNQGRLSASRSPTLYNEAFTCGWLRDNRSWRYGVKPLDEVAEIRCHLRCHGILGIADQVVLLMHNRVLGYDCGVQIGPLNRR
jgi:hypothetical protein